VRALAAIALLPAVAAADPCEDALGDPVATPLRETDAQRGACLRDELTTHLRGHALIDTPNFHGVVGGELGIGARFVVRERLELGARARVVDATFVQTAVNKVTAARFGPLAIGAAIDVPFDAHARLAVVALVELPYTRDAMETAHTSGQLGLAFTGALAPRWRLHARFGAHGAYARSLGGSTRRVALRAGTDLAWRFRPRWALHAGLDSEGGWRDGFSMLLARTGIAWRPRGGAYRATLAAGAPLGGDEPTTAIVTLGVARDL
jgi:hypothetical protein